MKHYPRTARLQPTRAPRLVWRAQPAFPRPQRPTLAFPARVRHPPTRERLLVVSGAIVTVLTAQPGISLRTLRASVRVVLGRCTDGDTDAALDLLGEGVRFDDGPRGAWKLTLDMSKAPPEVLVALAVRGGAP